MLPGMELLSCTGLAVPLEVMQHVVKVESSHNPYAIGVVGGHLVRQPRNLNEALATVRMLEGRGFNFSVGIAQVNRYNLGKYGLTSYARAFEVCPNLQAGARILAECYGRHQEWGKSFSCYYSGNPVTGFRHGYVRKVFASIARAQRATASSYGGIHVVERSSRRTVPVEHFPLQRDPRVDPPVSRAEAINPALVPAAAADPAFAGGGPMRGPAPAPVDLSGQAVEAGTMPEPAAGAPVWSGRPMSQAQSSLPDTAS